MNATAEIALYQGYNTHKMPTVLALANEVTYERHVSPANGTA